MSYCPQFALGFTPEQQAVLKVSTDELSRLPPDVRATLYLRTLEVSAHRRSAFWNAIGAIATALALLGVARSK